MTFSKQAAEAPAIVRSQLGTWGSLARRRSWFWIVFVVTVASLCGSLARLLHWYSMHNPQEKPVRNAASQYL